MPDTAELPEEEDAPIATGAQRYAPLVTANDGHLHRAGHVLEPHNGERLPTPCGYEPPAFGLERLEAGV